MNLELMNAFISDSQVCGADVGVARRSCRIFLLLLSRCAAASLSLSIVTAAFRALTGAISFDAVIAVVVGGEYDAFRLQQLAFPLQRLPREVSAAIETAEG